MDLKQNGEINEMGNEKTNSCKETVYRPTTEKSFEDLKQPELLVAENSKNGTCIFLYVSAISANLITFAAGICFSWTSPVIPQIQEKLGKELNPLPEAITESNESWIASLVCCGAAIGPLIAGRVVDKIGRKRTLLASALPLFISFLVLAFAARIELYYFARFFGGLTCGTVFGVVPMYLNEISESHNRGMINCTLGVFCALGVWYSYLVGPYVSVKVFSLTCTAPILMFFLVFGSIIPESPVYLISVKNPGGALASLRKLRKKNEKQLQIELAEITKTVEDAQANKSGILEIFKSKGLLKALIISVGLVLCQQFSGIGVVLSFMESIFHDADCGIPAELSVIFVGGVQVVVTIVTSVVVERLGRKLLLLISSFSCSVSLLALGLYFHLKLNNLEAVSNLSWLPIASLMVYILAFNLGLGPLPWTVMAELFPSNVASIAGTITSSSCFLAGYFMIMFFPQLNALLGMAPSFWLFAVFCALSFIFVLFAVLETKGKSPTEIQQYLSNCKK